MTNSTTKELKEKNSDLSILYGFEFLGNMNKNNKRLQFFFNMADVLKEIMMDSDSTVEEDTTESDNSMILHPYMTNQR